MLKVEDIMSKEIIWLLDSGTIVDAYNIMLELGFHHVPILDRNSMLVGIISDRDVLKYSSIVNNKLEIPDVDIKAVMSTDVITCAPQAKVTNILRTMLTCNISSVPVLEKNKAVGIITTTDILHLFSEQQILVASEAPIYQNETGGGLMHDLISYF